MDTEIWYFLNLLLEQFLAKATEFCNETINNI